MDLSRPLRMLFAQIATVMLVFRAPRAANLMVVRAAMLDILCGMDSASNVTTKDM